MMSCGVHGCCFVLACCVDGLNPTGTMHMHVLPALLHGLCIHVGFLAHDDTSV